MIRQNFLLPPFFTVLLIVIITATRWFLSPTKTTILLPDLLFIHSTITFILGLLIHITNTTRHHYYLHLMHRFSGKEIDDISYDEAEAKRKGYARLGQAIALVGLCGIGISGLLIFQYS